MPEAARPVNKINSLEPQNEAWPHTTTTKPQKAVSIKATEEEIRWVYLWKNRPSPSASPEDHRRWFKQVEQHSGISLNALEFKKQDSNIVPTETPSSDYSQSTKTSLPGTDKTVSPKSNASLGSQYDPSKSSNILLLANKSRTNDSTMQLMNASVNESLSVNHSNTANNTMEHVSSPILKSVTKGHAFPIEAFFKNPDITTSLNNNNSTPLKPSDRLLEAALKTGQDPSPFSCVPGSSLSSQKDKKSSLVVKQKLNGTITSTWESEDCLMAKDDLSDVEDIWDENSMSDISTNKEDLGKYSSMPIPADIFN